MDYIPTEILDDIIGYLRKVDVPKLRLVNTRFNLVATPFLQKLFQVDFREDSDIVKFVEVFENTFVPFATFGFGELVTAQPLEQFCVKWGNNVKFWKNCVIDESDIRNTKSSISINTRIILENCLNLEEIKYIVVREKEMGDVTGIPVPRDLKTTKLMEEDTPRNENVFLDQIFQKTPHLRYVSIENWGDATLTANILNQLYKINGTVQIRKLDILLQLPRVDMDYVKNLVAISTKFTILDLELCMTSEDQNPEPPQTGEILSKWIEMLAPLRKLSLKYAAWGNNGGDLISIPLHSLVNLRCLTVENLHTPVLPHLEFPVLTMLDYMYGGDKFSFSGCVFPNVKFASIDLTREEECAQWPLVLPNVQELYVLSHTLKGIFRFPKVKKLHIHVEFDVYASSDAREIHMKHCWNNLTRDAKCMSNAEICNFDLEAEKIDSMDSFGNLPLLTHLKFFGENIECWKAVIYASRTGQLRRLQKLVFSENMYFSERDEFRSQLMKYHDSTIISQNYKLPPFLCSKARS